MDERIAKHIERAAFHAAIAVQMIELLELPEARERGRKPTPPAPALEGKEDTGCNRRQRGNVVRLK